MTGLLMFTGNMGGLLSTVPAGMGRGAGVLALGCSLRRGMSILLAVLTWLFLRDNPRDLGLPSMQQLEGKPEYPPADGNWLEALATVLANPRTCPDSDPLRPDRRLSLLGGLWAIPYLREVHGMSGSSPLAHQRDIVCFALPRSGRRAVDRIGTPHAAMRGLGFVYVLCWLPRCGRTAAASAAVAGAVRAHAHLHRRGTLVWSCAKEVTRRPFPAPPPASSIPALSRPRPCAAAGRPGAGPLQPRAAHALGGLAPRPLQYSSALRCSAGCARS